MYCSNCGEEIDPKAAVCVKCGVATGTAKKFCSNCGTSVNENQAICVKCGVALKTKVGTSAGEKNRITAALLAFFLGGLGIHKFYLGKTGAAVTMLLVSILGAFLFFLGPLVMGTIAFVEFIIYLTKTDEQFDEIYVKGNKSWF